MSDVSLRPVALTLHEGEHALVLGPPRSGRTNVLAALAGAAGRDALLVVPGGGGARPPARHIGAEPVAVADLDDELTGAPGARAGRRLPRPRRCRRCPRPPGGVGAAGVHLVAATRADRYRGAYGHWSADLKASRAGWILRPDSIDADLLGCSCRPGSGSTRGRGGACSSPTGRSRSSR
ncbi:MAG: hypothetical protein R2695_09700 [Acidimicrobiales bacterium]